MIFAWVANGFLLVFMVWACAFMLRQRRARRRRRGELRISPGAGLVMGAMLLGFQAIVQPEARHMIVEEHEEKSFDAENEDLPGGRRFHEQLQRIRRGEEVEELTVRAERRE